MASLEPCLTGDPISTLFLHSQEVCINKYDINPENTQMIRNYCEENAVPIIGEIPFSPAVRRALVARKSLVEFDRGAVTDIVERMWTEIEGT